MQEESDKYIEEWTVIINRKEYHLTAEQTKIVKNNIVKDFRGWVMFDKFAINFPMIQEFFLRNKKVNPKYVLPSGGDNY